MDIAHVARLANLPLTSEKGKTYSSQLEKVLDYVKQLQRVDTASVAQTAQVTDLTNVTRKDKVESCPPLGDGYIKTKAIFSDE